MHFEILVEDQSGKKALNILVPKIIGDNNTFNIHQYKGIGRIPRGLTSTSDAGRRILLDQIPRLLRGYAKTFNGYPKDYNAAVILVCDLDDKCLKELRAQLFAVLNACDPAPETRFCIAIEEGEAWFLGDHNAIITAYPNAKRAVLSNYVNDSVCGTWETLAEAIYPGGYKMLSHMMYQEIGAQKSKWSETISPHMNIDNNMSPSFCYFRDKLRELRISQYLHEFAPCKFVTSG